MRENLLKPQELAAYLGISLNTVYSWVWSKKIPYHKPGGKLVRFNLADVDEYLKKCKIKPNPYWEETDGKHIQKGQ
jgi:excisionase family DNA binding protein